jgi:superfamily II DNA or RNA helicase
MESLFDIEPSPIPITDTREPRDFQKQAISESLELLNRGENPLIIMATGTGKTFTGSHIIKKRLEQTKGKTLWLAHREELILQAKESIESICGVRCGIELGEYHSTGKEQIIVGTVQSLHEKRLVSKFSPDHFSDIWIDEAHHSASKSYLNLVNYFPNARKIGLTATPDRADERGIGNIFTKIAYNYSLLDAIKNKNLCPIRGVRLDIEIDLSKVSTVAGDLNQGELDEAMSKDLFAMAEGIERETRDNRTIIFTVSVKTAYDLAELLQERGVKAKALDGKTDKDTRSAVISQFRKGEITHLVNCALFAEGFDAPETDAVVIGRPTKSRTLFSQMTGRGTRLFPGKQYMKLIEFTYAVSNHKLVKPYELFISETYDEEVRKKAEELAEEQNLFDVLELLETAKEKIHQDAIQKAIIKTYSKIEYDPLALLNIAGVSIDEELIIQWEGRTLPTRPGTITKKQKETLEKFKIADAGKLSMAHASKLIGTIAENKWDVERILRKAI